MLPNGVSATCTINNDDQAARLTLVKTVTNDNGGTATSDAWNLDAIGPTTITGVSGSAPVTNAPVDAGTYNLFETGPSGYTPSGWSCTAGTLTGSTLVLPNGVSATCTINNDDQPGTLTLVKTVTNDNGGTALPTDWTLTATGPTTITGVTGSAAVTGVPVSAGTYTLSESGGPSGYAAGAWSCTAGTLTGASLVLPNGMSATCTINNDDQPATLTLVKTVINDNGGTAVPTDFILSATPTPPIPGQDRVAGAGGVDAVPVFAGTYRLAEEGPAGYQPLAWSCVGGTSTSLTITLLPGESATCTKVNNDMPSALTLVKTVTNDDGGTAVATDWTLTATGPTNISGATGSDTVTNAPVDAGTYDLSESGGPSGYTPGAWSCTAGTLTGSSLVLPNGVSATCTIDNDDQPATLTLIKTVTNDNGGTAAPTSWTLRAFGPTTISGVTGSAAVTGASVNAGTYVLAESGPSGYTAGAWSCTIGETQVSGSAIELGSGQSATCTINNDDQVGTWTLAKTSDPESGSVVQPGSTIIYTIAATKTGGVDPTDLTVTDDLTGVLANATLDPTSITATTGTATFANGRITWTIPDLPDPLGSSPSATLTYSVTVNPNALGATLTNAVTGNGPNGPPTDCAPGAQPVAGAVDPCSTTHTTPPTWSMAKSSDPAPGSVVEPGSTITYTVTVTRLGELDPTGLSITDDLSDVLLHADIDQSSITATLGTPTFSSGRITWNIPDLSAPTATLTYQVTLNADAYGVTVTNVASGTAVSGPPTDCAQEVQPVAQVAAASVHATADDPCTTTHDTPPSPTWTLKKTSDPASGSVVQPGSKITYTLAATKTSVGVDPKGLLVTDDLSDVLAHATFDLSSITASTGTEASFAGGKLTWSIPDLPDAVGGLPSATVTYTVTVNADAFGSTLTNGITGVGGSGPPTDCAATDSPPPAEVAGGAVVALAAVEVTADDAACSTVHNTSAAPTTTTTAPPSVESATTVPAATQPESGLAFTGTRAGDLVSLGVILLALGLGLLAVRRRGRR
jgi:fimbrial isopeptide formation D2 family protein